MLLTIRPCKISIHAPTRGATLQVHHRQNMSLFQSTLLQEERLIIRQYVLLLFYISIHAPTRGATIQLQAPPCRVNISIHAPTRGATSSSCNKHVVLLISIHAPTRGATSGVHTATELLSDFNPRSYKRSDGF